MVKIIDTNELEVTKLNNKVKFTIKKNKFSFFYNKIKDILGKKTNQFTINAKNIVGLNNFLKSNTLNYNQAHVLFETLFTQIKNLESNKSSIGFLELSDVYFIDVNESEFYFVMLNSDKIVSLENDEFEIKSPVKKDDLFFSPEQKKLKSFPFKLSKKSVYYSMALITLFSLKKFKTKQLNLENHEETIIGTPLYWALERCLIKDIENRTLLYI